MSKYEFSTLVAGKWTQQEIISAKNRKLAKDKAATTINLKPGTFKIRKASE